jgi:hypothetical protein
MVMAGVANPMDEKNDLNQRQLSPSLREKHLSGRYLHEIGVVGWIVIIVILLAIFGSSNSGSDNYDPDGGYEPDICYDARAPYYC